MYTVTYSDENGNTWTEKNVILLNWINEEQIDRITQTVISRTLTDEEKKELFNKINKLDYFPEEMDLRELIYYVIANSEQLKNIRLKLQEKK